MTDKFSELNSGKKIILIASAVSLISLFLPWNYKLYDRMNAFKEGEFILFIPYIYLIIKILQKKKINMLIGFISVIIPMIFTFFFITLYSEDLHQNPLIGMYIFFISSILIFIGLILGVKVNHQKTDILTTSPLGSSSRPSKLSVAEAPSNDDKNNNLNTERITAKLSGQVTKLAGVEKLEGIDLKAFFSEVFRRHTKEEVEEYFTVGTASTTPSIEDVDTTWPRPWVFLKTFLGALAIYILFVMGWNEFQNINLIPGLIIMGSFAVPFSTLIFFVEVNVRRNVSLYQVIRLLFVGGILSLIISLILFEVTGELELDWLGASVAGLVEEPGKLLALLTVANISKYKYRLNGLLFGAAVGTGFAAFESAGYALLWGLEEGSDTMKSIIMTRGMLSPFAHIAWTAMCSAALWRVKGDRRLSFSMFKDERFLRIFAIAVVLHMIWNSPLNLPFYGKNILLGAVAWIVLLALIQDGLKELKEEKVKAITSKNKVEEPVISEMSEMTIDETKPKMVFVEGGAFQMGSNNGDSDEKPVHTVTVDSFWIDKYEVTQAEYQKVMGTNPSFFKCDDCPVEGVSWKDATEYARRVGKRLPTEAEWEYAARGGNQSRGYQYAGGNNLDEVAWYKINSGCKTHRVGEKQPNELGLYDITGNVWKWCADCYDKKYYKQSQPDNPTGPSSGWYRVLRGGSWRSNDDNCRRTWRNRNAPGIRDDSIGFRCVRDY